MADFNMIDAFIIGIIGLSVVTGLVRGFVKELVALCIWVLAIWLAYSYCQEVAFYLKPYISSDSARLVSGGVIILLLVVVGGSLFNILLSYILKSTGLTGTDRLLGMGFGLLRGVFIVSLLILATQMTSLVPSKDYVSKSYLYAKFIPLVDGMYGLSPDFIKHIKLLEANNDVQTIEP
ncbi:MAG: CvpA family protein [Legionellaceae bacterium]|nr:CvpA family protein [Legionellaceae bacterium]